MPIGAAVGVQPAAVPLVLPKCRVIAARSLLARGQAPTGARAARIITIALRVCALSAQGNLREIVIPRLNAPLREPIGAVRVIMAGALRLRAPFVLLQPWEIVMTLPRAPMPVLTGALQAVVAVAGAIVPSARPAIPRT